MTYAAPRLYWRPSYVRRMPRFYDGAGRMLDLGDALDLRLPPETDHQMLREDWLMIREDLRRSVDHLRERANALD